MVTDRSNKLRNSILHRLDMLFVNNRVRQSFKKRDERSFLFQGERIENADEKRIELLRTKFIVYEAEGIQCQLTFQNRTVTLNVIDLFFHFGRHFFHFHFLFSQLNVVHVHWNRRETKLFYISIETSLHWIILISPVN